MAYGNNDTEYEAGAPKKADVLIRSTQHIALKQEELSEQTKHAIARLDEAIELFSKNNQDASYVIKQSGEIFEQLQGENSALKQELLYLAKQSENIYAGLAEKINELSEQAKTRDESMAGFADKINDVSELTRKSEAVYADIVDKMAQLSEQTSRNESAFEALTDKLEAIANKLDAVSERTIKSERAYGELSERIVTEKVEQPSVADLSEVISKLNYVSDQLRRSEGAHTMLADKFEILSMRVEQFGFESAKGATAVHAQPAVNTVAYPAPVQTLVKEEINYDLLAEKVASLITAREVVSPDYIASKVAEQIVLPEIETANVKVSVDTYEIARQVAGLINENGIRVRDIPAARPVTVDIDEEEIAERIVRRLGDVKGEIAPAAAADIDEEELAQKLAEKLGGLKIADTAVVANANINEDELAQKLADKLGGVRADGGAVTASLNIDEEELADRIALKVGSLKSEEFEILVDDEGCNSISKEIANKLNYDAISNVIADKLREVLDLAAANAPDYEEMAERISEKITVAGINEDAIADKAAAVLSNYLPEIDTDEIADKVTGAVIDVVSAIPQPTVDNELIISSISQKLIESQEDHDYDIVIDDDGISRITELVTSEIEKGTGERFNKVDEELSRISELLTPAEEPAEEASEAEEAEADNEAEEVAEDGADLAEVVAAEIEKGTASRFDKVEEDIAKLAELVSNVISDVEYTGEPVNTAEVDYNKLTEAVSAEIEKSVSTRIYGVEQNIAKLNEYLTSEDAIEYEEFDEQAEYNLLSEVVAAELQKSVTSRLDSVEQNIAIIKELVASGETTEVVERTAAVEEDYSKLSEVVAAEIEKGIEKSVGARLGEVEQNIARITEAITESEEDEEYDEQAEEAAIAEEEEQYYAKLSEVVAAEIEKGVGARLGEVEQNIARITEAITESEEDEEYDEQAEEAAIAEEEEQYYAKLSEVVAAEIEKGVGARFDSVEENIASIKELVASGETAEVVERTAAVEEDYSKLSEVVAAEIEKGVGARLGEVEQNIAKLTEAITESEEDEEYDEQAEEAAIAEEEEQYYAKLSEVVAAEIEKGVGARLGEVEQNIAKLTEAITESEEDEEYDEQAEEAAIAEEEEQYYAKLSEVVAAEIEKGVSTRFDNVEKSVASIKELVVNGEAAEVVTRTVEVGDDYSKLTEAVAAEIEKSVGGRLDKVDENLAKMHELVNEKNQNNARLERLEDNIARISDKVDGGAVGVASVNYPDFEKFEEDVQQIKEMLASGIIAANIAADEAAAAQAAQSVIVIPEEEAEEEEEALVTVSDLVPDIQEEPEEETVEEEPVAVTEDVAEELPVEHTVEEQVYQSAAEVKEPAKAGSEYEEFEEDEEEEDDDDGLDGDDDLIDVFDMDKFSDNELMPGEMSDLPDGVDFANMMKFKRSFIARIIQSNDDYKQYYGEVKHALLSYKKVNSNVAWGAERFNKGRETIARMKIRGKTLCLYLALDPNNYKTSVYHHLDVSDNKSVNGTPMMVKIKSPLGARKAIRLIDEMLALRNGEKKEIPERDYAAMYPYETIEELIEEGLVKDVRKNK